MKQTIASRFLPRPGKESTVQAFTESPVSIVGGTVDVSKSWKNQVTFKRLVINSKSQLDAAVPFENIPSVFETASFDTAQPRSVIVLTFETKPASLGRKLIHWWLSCLIRLGLRAPADGGVAFTISLGETHAPKSS